jgi:hypothetical protein
LRINNIEDESNNFIDSNSQSVFRLLIIEEADAFDVVINEFLVNPVNEPGSVGEFIELINISEKYLQVSNWTFSDATGTSDPFPEKIFEPGEILILAPSNYPENLGEFGFVLPIPRFRTLNNGFDDIVIRDYNSKVLFEISYSSSELGISAELINPLDPCITELSYAPSLDPDGHSAGQVNSVFDEIPDTQRYNVPGLTVVNLNFGVSPVSLDVFFAEPIVEGVVYELRLSGVSDCWGNVIEPTTIQFGVGRSPLFNEIIITEIHADPDPSMGLPDVEYIEIYNTSNELLRLSGLEFRDATSAIILPDFSVNPMDYCVLTTVSGSLEFTNINAVGVPGFPSLNNEGEQLILSNGDELIFSVAYTKDWHDEVKSEGGYSLEMKDLNNSCVEDFNWGSSHYPNGGTPGFVNSMEESIPDNFGPEIVDVLVISPNSFQVNFNENIDPEAELLTSISFRPSLEIDSIYFQYQHPKSLFITLSEPLIESTPHVLVLTNLTDCNGNEIQNSESSLALPSASNLGDILLSEVLFNPRTNGYDFVEIYNNTEKYINLQDWELGRITESGISDGRTISSQPLIVAPEQYLALTTEVATLSNYYPNALLDNVYEISAMPIYANDSGNVVLINNLGEVQEVFHYEDDYHFDLLESTDGISLERISFSTEVNDRNNWRSASSVAGFATPGMPNSQSMAHEIILSGNVSIEPKVFVPGNSGSGMDYTTINYQFDEPGKFANITIYDQSGRLVKNLAEGALLSTSGFLRWDGTTNAGSIARLGYHVVLFEVFDSAGNTDVFKETVVVGRNF